MSTVLFVYTEGVTYKATNVTSITHNESMVEYSQTVLNESGTVGGLNLRAVDKSDLLYAVVRNTESGEVTIILGLYDSFDIVPKGDAVRRQTNVEAEAARVAAYRAEQAPAREAKEQAKYEARRAKRKAAYTGTTATVVHEDADEPEIEVPQEPVVEVQEVQEVQVVETAETTAPVTATTSKARKSVNVLEQLKAAGISEEDLAALRNLGILR
jgi:hypothetical protein